MKGMKTGGRVAGTPNVERKELIELLAEKYPGYHPVLAMADIANNKKNNLHFILQANKEVAKYVCPQLKAVELKSNIDNITKVIFQNADNSKAPIINIIRTVIHKTTDIDESKKGN